MALVAREREGVRRPTDVHVPEYFLRARADGDHIFRVEATYVEHVALARRDDVVGAVADHGGRNGADDLVLRDRDDRDIAAERVGEVEVFLGLRRERGRRRGYSEGDDRKKAPCEHVLIPCLSAA